MPSPIAVEYEIGGIGKRRDREKGMEQIRSRNAKRRSECEGLKRSVRRFRERERVGFANWRGYKIDRREESQKMREREKERIG